MNLLTTVLAMTLSFAVFMTLTVVGVTLTPLIGVSVAFIMAGVSFLVRLIAEALEG